MGAGDKVRPEPIDDPPMDEGEAAGGSVTKQAAEATEPAQEAEAAELILTDFGDDVPAIVGIAFASAVLIIFIGILVWWLCKSKFKEPGDKSPLKILEEDEYTSTDGSRSTTSSK